MIKKFTVVILSVFLTFQYFNCDTVDSTSADTKDGVLVVQDEIVPEGKIVQLDDYPLFVMNYIGDYGFHNYLNTGISKNKYYLQEDLKSWGCTCFSAMADSCKIFGRNFDYYHHIALILYTHSSYAYSSISVTDITYLGFSENSSLEQVEHTSSVTGSPYCSMDGLNEKGVSIGLMSVPGAQPPFDPNKISLGCLDIIRLILDYAANTEEAVSLIQKYNFKDEEHPVHYLISDRNGNSVVIEFVNGELKVIHNNEPLQVSTNFIITGSNAPLSTTCWRYNSAYKSLKSTNGFIDKSAAMNILKSVSQNITMWSAVYDNNSFSLNICIDKKYDKIYSVKVTGVQ